jgi:hypothetical protein
MRGASTCFCAIRISWPNDIRICVTSVVSRRVLAAAGDSVRIQRRRGDHSGSAIVWIAQGFRPLRPMVSLRPVTAVRAGAA